MNCMPQLRKEAVARATSQVKVGPHDRKGKATAGTMAERAPSNSGLGSWPRSQEKAGAEEGIAVVTAVVAA
jgi:hypothetical protein